MAKDTIARLKLDTSSYDAKLKKATEGLRDYAQECRNVGGTLEYVDDGVLEFIKALGSADTVAKTSKGQLREYTQALNDLTLMYRQMSDAEKNSAPGRALAESIEQLKQKAGEVRDTIDDVNATIKHAASDTKMFDQIAGAADLAVNSFQALQGASKVLGIDMGDNVEVIAKLQAAMALTNGLTKIQAGLQKESAAMQMVAAIQTSANATAQSLLAKNTALATAAGKAFNLVAKANPYILLASALVAAAAAFALFTSEQRKAEREAEELAQAEEEAAKRADELRESFVNASAQMMNTASRISYLQTAYKNANDEMSRTDILREAASEFKKLGIACKGVNDAQKLLVERGKDIVDLIRLQGNAAAIAALRMDAYKKSFKMLLENGYDAKSASILAGSNADVQALDAELTEIQQRIQGIRSTLPMGGSGSNGGSRGGGKNTYEPHTQALNIKPMQRVGVGDAYDRWGNLLDTPRALTPEERQRKYILAQSQGLMSTIPPSFNFNEDSPEVREWRKQQINKEEMREAFKEGLGNFTESMGKTANGISQLVSGVQQLGIKVPAGISKMLSVMQAITSILTAIQTLETIKGWFHNGGMVRAAMGYTVPGNYGFDAVPAMLTSGEVVLNRAQQGVLASQLADNARSMGTPSARVSGEDIYIAVSHYMQRRGYGEFAVAR